MNDSRIMVKMSSLIKSISMGPFGSDVKVEYMVKEGVPFLDGSNLASVRMNADSLKFVTREKADSLKNALAHPYDIVVTHRGTIGQLSYIPDDLNYKEFLISQSQFRVTLDTSKVDPVFFAYYFHTKEGQKRLLSFANYVGVPALASATTNFKELEFPLIPLSKQKKIAKLILRLDEKIRNNNACCTDLEAMAKQLYDYWFVQFDFPDENGKPYKSSGGKMVWNDDLKREIPEGWGVHPSSDYLKAVRGVSYSANDLIGNGVPMFNLNSFNEDGSYKVSGIKTYSGLYAKEKTVEPNDLIMCVTQQTDIDLTGKKNVIGKTILVPCLNCKEMTMSMDVVKLVSDNKKLYAFFKYYFSLPHIHKYVVGYANGTKIKHLDIEGALTCPVVMPEEGNHLLDEFSSMINNINAITSNAIGGNKQLASLRDFLVPMLMNGQVKVGEKDDQPPKVLSFDGDQYEYLPAAEPPKAYDPEREGI